LNGEQGVVLPRRNLDHLCLRKSVRDAVAEGRFHLWGIDRVEEGWPILADRDAGDESGDGTFPEGTVHHAVRTRLAAWAERWRRMDEGSEDEGPVDAE
jgi:predicted ATP-dependent protease